jgi:hypothetical protein
MRTCAYIRGFGQAADEYASDVCIVYFIGVNGDIRATPGGRIGLNVNSITWSILPQLLGHFDSGFLGLSFRFAQTAATVPRMRSQGEKK